MSNCSVNDGDGLEGLSRPGWIRLLRLLHNGCVNDLATGLLGAYDEFLGILSDARMREYLDKLDTHHQYEDESFLKARQLTHRSRDSVRDDQLKLLTRI